jgi:predicted enzyme related to lactoylglutathione lyase
MTVANVLAGVAVRELNTAVAWYERVLGRPADTRPMSEVAEWRFPEGGWLQVFRDPQRAGSSSVTFAVRNLDEELRGLRSESVQVGQTSDTDMVKTAIVADPDGNQIVFAQAKTAGIAS